MHDPLDARDMVVDLFEYMRNRGFGYDEELFKQAMRLVEKDDQDGLWEIHNVLEYIVGIWEEGRQEREPDDWEAIASLMPVSASKQVAESGIDLDSPAYSDKVHGAWLGRCVACCMGKPIECMSKEQIRDYLHHVGSWPVTGYIPFSTYVPQGAEGLNPSSPVATAGNIKEMPRDDDTDYTILGLHMLETYGRGLECGQVAQSWFESLPYWQTYTAERATYHNLVMGVEPGRAGAKHNPYREWIGALIRADIYGYVFPGMPLEAARAAYVDAVLSHRGNGIYGELWAAALVSLAFTAQSLELAIQDSLAYVPVDCELRRVVGHVLSMWRNEASWDEVLGWIDSTFADYSWVHVLNNAALIAAGLLWGRGDFRTAVGLVIQGGYDTDSAGATVGSVVGAFLGSAGIPSDLSAPLNNRIRSAVPGFDGYAIDALADRMAALGRSFAAQRV